MFTKARNALGGFETFAIVHTATLPRKVKNMNTLVNTFYKMGVLHNSLWQQATHCDKIHIYNFHQPTISKKLSELIDCGLEIGNENLWEGHTRFV